MGLPPCGQTDTYENITFPKLRWRVVKMEILEWITMVSYACHLFRMALKELMRNKNAFQ